MNNKEIQAAMARFPKTFGLRAFQGDVFRISERDSYMSGNQVMLYTERFDINGKWLSFCKGTPSELLGQIVYLPTEATQYRAPKGDK